MSRVLILFKILAFGLFLLAGSVLYSDVDESEDEGWDWRFSGYYKNLFMYQEYEYYQPDIYSLPSEKKLISDMNRLRLTPEIIHNDNFIFHADADLEVIKSNYNKTDLFDTRWRDSGYNEFVKLSGEPYYSSGIYCRAEMHTLYVKMTSGKFTGTAGRHQVRFGSSRLWNPLDLMNPISPTGVEGSDEQRGTDALRLDWYPGESTEFTGVVSPLKENDKYEDIRPESLNYIARFKTGMKEFDAAVLGGYTAKRVNSGADITAEIYDGLLTVVFLYSSPSEGENYYQFGSGYEYTFSTGLYLITEYFYNSLPVNEDAELRDALVSYSINGADESNFYTVSNRMITYNSHYLSMAAGYDFFPLLRGEIFSIYDIQGGGVFVNLSLKFNALENLDITAGVITAFVNENKRESDFKIYDEDPLYYATVQFYF